ncbi:MAG: CPBP family glutamic-type intramembrane protease [Firmicutes bacterium]|nr:CPBP family glutamic-type intramembrane protease [Bacillota bacterium]
MIMEDYSRMHRYYDKASGLLAIGIFAVSSLLFYLTGLLWRHQSIRVFIPASIFSIAIVLMAMAFCKEEIRSVGISLRGVWKSALLGLTTGAAFFFSMRLILQASVFERAYGGAEISRFMTNDRFFHVAETPFLSWFPQAFVFVLVTVIHQEILMRGYVQTRLNGLIKSELATTAITGFMFVVFFMPLHTVIIGESFSWVFGASIPIQMIWMFCLHCWLHFLYRTYNNLAGPIIFHIFFTFHSNAALAHSFYMGIG